MKRVFLGIILALTAQVALAGEHDFEVVDAFAYPPLQGVKNAVAYMELHNHGTEPVRVTGITTALTEHAELHDHIDNGDVMRMQRIDAITVAPGEAVVLESGGKHVMLIDVTEPMVPGDLVKMQLQLADGTRKNIQVPIIRRQPAHSASDHSHHSEEDDEPMAGHAHH